MKTWKHAINIAVLVAVANCCPVFAGASEPPRMLRTAQSHHSVTIRGVKVSYTSIVSANVVPDARGLPGATVLTIAYLKDDVKDGAARPVLFAFNGGPGASSSPLHMAALGPVIRTSGKRSDRTSGVLEDNSFSALDATDIVFIDPVSTGFSRAFPNVDPKQWYDSRFDAITVAGTIAAWLKEHRRESSPRYLAGESYGTTRAGLILRYAPSVRFDGVLLISGGTGGGERGDDARAINNVPSMAAGAWYHNKVPRRGMDVEAFYRAAAKFAQGEYAAALSKGDSLAPAEQREIAQHLAAYIGLPAELIVEKNLRIDRNTYSFNLLKDQGLRTGVLDIRVTGPLAPGQEGAIDDPALGVVKPGTGAPPSPAAIGAVASPVVGRYMVEHLNYLTTDTYYGVNFLANSQWTWHEDDSTAQFLSSAMQSDPRLRLFVTSGYFDFGSSDASAYLAAGVPADRLTFVPLPGPHEVYAGAANRAAFNDAVRRFVVR